MPKKCPFTLNLEAAAAAPPNPPCQYAYDMLLIIEFDVQLPLFLLVAAIEPRTYRLSSNILLSTKYGDIIRV